MSWASDKARDLVSCSVPGCDCTADQLVLVERAIRETLAEAKKAADACSAERAAQLEGLLRDGPADERHALVVAKCSEAERIAAAIRKLGEP